MTRPSKFAGLLTKLNQTSEEPEIKNSGTARQENQEVVVAPALSENPEKPKTRNPEKRKTRNPEKKTAGRRVPRTAGTPDQETSNTGNPVPVNAGNHEDVSTRNLESVNTGFPEFMNSDIRESPTSRPPEFKEKYSTLIDRDLVQELRLYAVRHRMKDWQVLDAALRAFLKSQD